MINKIAAIVVLYHPNKEVFNNILTYSKTIKNIIIIDNSESGSDQNMEYIDGLRKRDPNREFYYYCMGSNKGLAEAFNYGLDMADKIGCDWCFTMDSDSSFENDIAAIYRYIEKKHGNARVIAYSPQYNYDRIIPEKNDKVKKITWSMTSGTMFHIKKIIESGGFDPWFFVDGLDVELGYRLKKAGFIILRCNAAMLNHHPANTVRRKLFGRTIKYGIAAPIRYYYQARADVRILMTYFAPYALFDLFMRLAKILLLFDRKKEYLYAWIHGIDDAIHDRGGRTDISF